MENLCERTLEAIPYPIAVINLDGRIVFANLATGRLIGVPKDHLIGKSRT
ncbi:MAG TPA: PAS domain-containing protein [Candidatus Aquicultor sp.]